MPWLPQARASTLSPALHFARARLRARLRALGRGACCGLLGLSACRPETKLERFTEPETQRDYQVVTRAGHDTKRAAPALFALHAYATAPNVLPDAFSLAELAAEARGFILVVPEGKRDDDGHPFWNASRACCGKTQVEVDDVGYLRRVLADVKRHHAVDPARVYALGVSNGGFMAHRWACDGELSAIAAVSGVGSGEDDPVCAPPRPVRVLQIHGDRDDIIPYEGSARKGARQPSAFDSSAQWAARNGSRLTRDRAKEFSFIHGSTTKTEWGDAKARVTLWTFLGGTHNLRSVRFASSEILDFLAQ